MRSDRLSGMLSGTRRLNGMLNGTPSVRRLSDMQSDMRNGRHRN